MEALIVSFKIVLYFDFCYFLVGVKFFNVLLNETIVGFIGHFKLVKLSKITNSF
jgi:hypothetical protein